MVGGRGGGSEKKGNKNKKSVCGDYKNRADARAGLAIVVNQNEASSSRNISIFVNSHTDGRTDGRSDGGDPERERERSNKAKEARSIYIPSDKRTVLIFRIIFTYGAKLLAEPRDIRVSL